LPLVLGTGGGPAVTFCVSVSPPPIFPPRQRRAPNTHPAPLFPAVAYTGTARGSSSVTSNIDDRSSLGPRSHIRCQLRLLFLSTDVYLSHYTKSFTFSFRGHPWSSSQPTTLLICRFLCHAIQRCRCHAIYCNVSPRGDTDDLPQAISP